MFDRLRRRASYANVMSTLAVFIALGGSSYAAVRISGSDIKSRSIAASKLKRNTLSGLEIREAALGRVPRAQRADTAATLEGVTVGELRIQCPSDTFPSADVCVETTPRRSVPFGSAVLECMDVGTPAGPGRRLPTYGELFAALASVSLAPGGELTSEVYPSGANPGELDALYVTTETGRVALTPDRGEGGKAFRCVTDPLN